MYRCGELLQDTSLRCDGMVCVTPNGGPARSELHPAARFGGSWHLGYPANGLDCVFGVHADGRMKVVAGQPAQGPLGRPRLDADVSQDAYCGIAHLLFG